MNTPTIERGVVGRDDRPGVIVRCPYDAGVVEALKGLPRADRYWDPDAGAWWVAGEHEDAAAAALWDRWPEVLFLGADGEGDELVDRDGVAYEQGRLL